MSLDTMTVPRVVIDVASEHPGVADVDLRQVFARASRFLFGGMGPSVGFYGTGEVRGARAVSRDVERAGMERIAGAMRLYMELPAGVSLEWFYFDSRYCLRALAAGRRVEVAVGLGRRFRPDLFD
jgi:hypothetical protein